MPGKITDEEKQFIETMVVADAIYDGVVGKLAIDREDVLYRGLVFSMLKRQTTDFIVFNIWKNLDEGQLAHLREFINQISVTMPFLPHEEILMEFALTHPKLLEKIFEGLPGFFEGFIKRFNEIMAA